MDVVHSHPVWLPRTETWLFNQVRFLPPEVRSHVVCDRTQNLDEFAVPNLHALESRGRLRLLADKSLRKLHVPSPFSLLARVGRDSGARVVHSHFGSVGWEDMPAVRRIGARHVVTFYGTDVNQLPTQVPRWRARYRDLFAGVDRVLCEGEHMAACIVALGCSPDRVRVHHLGVTLDGIDFAPRAWSEGEPLRVLIAATFREKKGVPYAMEALGRLATRIPVEVTVIGEATAEPRSRQERERILATVERHGLGPRIRWLGFQPHATLFREAYRHHLFLSPSVTASDGDTEGGAPVSIIEMAATGMPVVSTTHCDIPGILRDGESGLLAAERDVDGLVERLEWLVENPGGWARMATAARRHVEAEFDAATQGRRLAAVYHELAG